MAFKKNLRLLLTDVTYLLLCNDKKLKIVSELYTVQSSLPWTTIRLSEPLVYTRSHALTQQLNQHSLYTGADPPTTLLTSALIKSQPCVPWQYWSSKSSKSQFLSKMRDFHFISLYLNFAHRLDFLRRKHVQHSLSEINLREKEESRRLDILRIMSPIRRLAALVGRDKLSRA